MPRTAPPPTDIALAVTGSGGSGALTAGSILLEAAAGAGLYGLLTRSVGPQIRGGEAAALLRLAARPLGCGAERFDLLVAMDWLNLDRFIAEIPLDAGSLVLADPKAGEVPESVAASGARVTPLAMQELAAGIEGGRPNMIALGAAARISGLPEDGIVAVVERSLAGKGAEAVRASIAGIRAGAAAVAKLAHRPPLAPPEADRGQRWAITGNEATGLGAVRGGVRFAAAYPITPATEILEWLAPALAKVGGTLVQAEDELASINMIIGASFGGTPSITATSGPGLALMIESMGLATAAEVPVVVVDVMRGGPSTGIPTKSEQSDLNIAVYGFHGDAPHLVLAPLSVGDCLFTAQWAVHLAEAMQAPAIVLSDQFIGQARAVIDRPADVAFLAQREAVRRPVDDYQRYALTASSVSPMAIPGTTGAQYTADGLEHNSRGTPSTRVEDHAAQLDKRRDKLTGFTYGDHWAEIDGEGPLAVITWGSSAGAAREALARVREMGVAARLVAPRLLAPAQPERMAAALDGVERALVVEQSHSGQFHQYLRAHYELPGEVRQLHRPGPLPLRAGEIVERIIDWT